MNNDADFENARFIIDKLIAKTTFKPWYDNTRDPITVLVAISDETLAAYSTTKEMVKFVQSSLNSAMLDLVDAYDTTTGAYLPPTIMGPVKMLTSQMNIYAIVLFPKKG